MFNINHSDLIFYDKDLKLIAEPGDFDVMISGNSRDELSNLSVSPQTEMLITLVS